MLKFTSRNKSATCFAENFKVIVITRSALFNSKCIRKELAARLCPDQLGDLQRSPTSWIKEVWPPEREGGGEGNGKKEEGKGEGREWKWEAGEERKGMKEGKEGKGKGENGRGGFASVKT